ncbi:ATP-binding protein [Streptomyces sp. NPDC002851]
MKTRRSKHLSKTSVVLVPHSPESAGAVQQFRALTVFAEAPDATRAARDLARSALLDWELPHLVEDVRLAVSELVGNAVHHAVPDDCLARPGVPRRIDVTLRKWPKWLFLGVADEDSIPPTLPAGEVFSPELVGGLAEAVLPDHGRGLLLVQQLADALWWAPQEAGGKTVFCRFDLDGGHADSSS